MTPHEKAQNLVSKYFNDISISGGYTMTPKNAKDCAIIAANEIIQETLSEYTNDENHVRVDFWKEVIEKIQQE